MAELVEEEKKGHSSDALSQWLTRIIVLLVFAAAVLSIFIVKAVFFTKRVPRTAIERDLMRYQEEVRENPNDWKSRLNLGITYYAMEDYNSAIKEFKVAIRLKPKASTGHYYLALAYQGKNDIKKAIEELQSTVELDTQHDQAYFQLGDIYMKQKKYELAIKEFKKSLENNPVNANYHYSLGVAYERTNRKDLAIKEYQEALRYVPDFDEAKDALKRLSS